MYIMQLERICVRHLGARTGLQEPEAPWGTGMAPFLHVSTHRSHARFLSNYMAEQLGDRRGPEATSLAWHGKPSRHRATRGCQCLLSARAAAARVAHLAVAVAALAFSDISDAFRRLFSSLLTPPFFAFLAMGIASSCPLSGNRKYLLRSILPRLSPYTFLSVPNASSELKPLRNGTGSAMFRQTV